jgi:hypothetical protein
MVWMEAIYDYNQSLTCVLDTVAATVDVFGSFFVTRVFAVTVNMNCG